MKKKPFITLIITTHLIFIFLHIYKNTLFTQESFTKQRYDKELKDLKNLLQVKKNELLLLQNQDQVAIYAQQEFSLSPLNIHQIRRIS